MTRAVVVPVLAGLALACASLGRRASEAYMAVASELAPDHARIEIRRDFLEAYKDRVTIETRFTVDAVASTPNPAAFDGDLHFSGRAPEVGLRLVGEIKRAADAPAAIALLREAGAGRRTLAITGAWRIWPEHSLGSREEQGYPLQPLGTPYPDHVFEVHPVTRIGTISLLEHFKIIEGYKPGSAERTLGSYQDASSQLAIAGDRVRLVTSSWLYNDVHFLMEIAEARHQVVADGRFVQARALTPEGKPLVERVRMVFVGGSAPERQVRSLGVGARLHVWGLPRLSFAELSRRLAASRTNPAALEGPLPYEIVVIGVYP